ncbi:MAG TPA: alpha/beta hydrolase, partial [Chitinophagales bacterium]|nr:alpha/beta hydrolase [Chitinophagales bacterium]
ALALRERHAALVEALGLFHSHPFADTEEQKEKRTKDAAFIERNGSEKFVPVLIPKLFADAFVEKQKDVVNGLVEQNKNLDANALVYALNAMRSRPDRAKVVASLTKPFLWIAGGRDQVISLESVNKMYALPPVASGLFLREAGHMGMVESTPGCAGHILNWMASVSNA